MLSAEGNVMWGKTFGDQGLQEAYDVSSGSEMVFLAGAFTGTLSGAPTAVVSSGAEDAFVIGLWH